LAHREGRRLLAVERAQPHPVGAALAELHPPRDDVDDVDAVEEVLFEGVRDHSLVAERRIPGTIPSKNRSDRPSGGTSSWPVFFQGLFTTKRALVAKRPLIVRSL